MFSQSVAIRCSTISKRILTLLMVNIIISGAPSQLKQGPGSDETKEAVEAKSNHRAQALTRNKAQINETKQFIVYKQVESQTETI